MIIVPYLYCPRQSHVYFRYLGVCFQGLLDVMPYLQEYTCCGSLGLLKDGPGMWELTGEKTICVDLSVHCGCLLRCGKPGNSAETGLYMLWNY